MKLFRRPTPAVTSQTSILEAMRLAPQTLAILQKHGVTKLGNALNPLETVETVATGNGLSAEQMRAVVQAINESLKKKEDPSLVQGELVRVTPAAAEELRAFLKRKRASALRLRLVSDTMIHRYDLDATSRKGRGDVEYEAAGLRFYIEKNALPLLKGVRIDYKQRERGFVFENPNLA